MSQEARATSREPRFLRVLAILAVVALTVLFGLLVAGLVFPRDLATGLFPLATGTPGPYKGYSTSRAGGERLAWPPLWPPGVAAEDRMELGFPGAWGAQFSTSRSATEVLAFYRKRMTEDGWRELAAGAEASAAPVVPDDATTPAGEQRASPPVELVGFSRGEWRFFVSVTREQDRTRGQSLVFAPR
jgi:hypothetical protein